MMFKLFFFALLVGYNMAQNPVCVQPIETGPCEAYIPRYAFNATSFRCEPFTYGGCDGNCNNFESAAECENTCHSQCLQPIVVGPCKAAFPRYAFNVDTWCCELFTYGGCQGNSNNFKTRAECQETCNETCCE